MSRISLISKKAFEEEVFIGDSLLKQFSPKLIVKIKDSFDLDKRYKRVDYSPYLHKVGENIIAYGGSHWNGSFHDAQRFSSPIYLLVSGKRAFRRGIRTAKYLLILSEEIEREDEVVKRFRLRDLVRQGD